MKKTAIVILTVLVAACGSEPIAPEEGDGMAASNPSAPGVTAEPFGTLQDGREVTLYTLRNAGGLTVRAMDYGGIIVSLLVPDASSELADITLGYDDLDGYLAETPYFGALIGRYGNRIGGARFTLEGTTYELAANDGLNHLHGGIVGFDKVLWEAEPVAGEIAIVFRHRSPDGDEGYPGNVDVAVTYTLTDDNELVFDYRATTDAPTPVNLTQHAYFNLAGHDRGDVLGHRLRIDAAHFTPVDPTLIPTGEVAPVEATPFDFRTPVAIGARIDADHEQIARGGGYDHNFVLVRDGVPAAADVDDLAAALAHAARVSEPSSGRVMDVYTTEPGVQFYSGNFLDGSLVGKGGTAYAHRSGFCLETQHFPDAPNRPEFPSTILRPGQEYRSRTVYRFSTE